MSALDAFKKRVKNKIWAPAKEMSFVELTKCQLPKQIVKDRDYIQIWIKSMRLVHARIGARKFHCAIFGSVSLTSISGKATFNVVNTPSSLQNLAGRDVDKIIKLDESIVGPVPYRGGNINIELGLFSVLSKDLVNLYLAAITDLNRVAGVKFVDQAIPFVQPIDNFVHLLLGADQDNKLEIGIEKNFTKDGVYAVIDASKDQLKKKGIDTQSLVLDADYHLMTQDGTELKQFPYFVFSIEAQQSRDDWTEIQELRDARKNITDAIRAREPKSISEFFNIFESLITTHPDIVLDHAKAIVKDVKEKQVDPWLEKLKPKEPPVLKPEDRQIKER